MRAERYLRSHHCQEFRSQDKDPRYLLYMCDFSITSWGFYLPPILSWVTLLLPYLEEWRIDSLLRVLFALLTDPLFFSIGGVIRCVAWRELTLVPAISDPDPNFLWANFMFLMCGDTIQPYTGLLWTFWVFCSPCCAALIQGGPL